MFGLCKYLMWLNVWQKEGVVIGLYYSIEINSRMQSHLIGGNNPQCL